MANRADQGSAALCPWCEAPLPLRAVECPDCRFPMSVPGALPPRPSEDGPLQAAPLAQLRPISGLRPADGEPARPESKRWPHLGPTFRKGPPVRRSHRMTLVAMAMAMTAFLVLLSGLYTWREVNRPAARQNRAALATLDSALRQARGLAAPVGAPAPVLVGDEPSTAPNEVSVAQPDGSRDWYGATRSASGVCLVTGGRLDATIGSLRSYLPSAGTGGAVRTDAPPCTGTEAQKVLARPLAGR